METGFAVIKVHEGKFFYGGKKFFISRNAKNETTENVIEIKKIPYL